MVGILILVDKDKFKTLLVLAQDVRTFLEQLGREHDQIIKVHRLILPEFFLVEGVDLGHGITPKISGPLVIGFRSNQLILRCGNGGKYRLGAEVLLTEIQLGENLFNYSQLVLGIIDDKMLVQPDKMPIGPENPDTGRVKGGNQDGFSHRPD